MANRKEAPEVNAGSMADIAFLLLIFFLVTTVIETDAGMNRMLPPITTTPPDIVKERNLLEISLNEKNELMVEEDIIDVEHLKELAIAFLDNGGFPSNDPDYCDYCQGERNPDASDNPSKAVISLTSHRQSNYGTYIAVQNELLSAYNTLRNREANRLFGQSLTSLENQYNNPATTASKKLALKDKIRSIQDLFPLNLVEAEIQ